MLRWRGETTDSTSAVLVNISEIELTLKFFKQYEVLQFLWYSWASCFVLVMCVRVHVRECVRDMIRYDTIYMYLRALKSWQNGQLSLAHGGLV